MKKKMVVKVPKGPRTAETVRREMYERFSATKVLIKGRDRTVRTEEDLTPDSVRAVEVRSDPRSFVQVLKRR